MKLMKKRLLERNEKLSKLRTISKAARNFGTNPIKLPVKLPKLLKWSTKIHLLHENPQIWKTVHKRAAKGRAG